jgi:diguanylate cyclase (GGDEF)-like protein
MVEPDPTGSTDHDGYRLAKSFQILLRSPDDVVVLQPPSWWNLSHTLWLLAVALLLISGILAWVLVLRMRLAKQADQFQFQATHDGLTGLCNRKGILDLLCREYELATRSGKSIGIMMLDADHFKRINDSYGRLSGDSVLIEIANRIRKNTRSTELAGRYGGEEFLLVLPESEQVNVATVAERIRSAVASEPVHIGDLALQVTLSIGICILQPLLHTAEEALASADTALYESKNAGRNRVSFSSPQTLPSVNEIAAPSAPHAQRA